MSSSPTESCGMKNKGQGVKQSKASTSQSEQPPVKKQMQYKQKYIEKYTTEWPCLVPSKMGESHIFCNVCNSDFSVTHGGRDDCVKHVKRKKHLDMVRIQGTTTTNITTFFKPSHSSQENDVINAEV